MTMRIRLAAPLAAALLMFGAMGTAHAGITTSNDAKGETTSREGTSAAAVDHMETEVNDGNLEGDGVKTVWKVIKRTPRVDAEGNPVLGSNGLQIIDETWGRVPIGNGVDPATIVHN